MWRRSFGVVAMLPLASAAAAACTAAGCDTVCPCDFDRWPEPRLVRYGYGMTAILTDAAFWYRRAAEAGDAPAQYNLGVMLMSGRGVARDPAAALAWLRRAAAAGKAEAGYAIGTLYRLGEAVPADPTVAVEWFRRGAEAGDPPAQVALGNMLGNGRGIARDLVRAYAWFRIAAENGLDTAAALDLAGGLLAMGDVVAAERMAERWRDTGRFP